MKRIRGFFDGAAWTILRERAAVPKRMPKPEPFPNHSHHNESSDDVHSRKNRVKIVIATPAHPTYADVRVFQKEARSLASHGYEVVLFAQAEGHLEPFVEEGVRVIPLCYTSRVALLADLPRLFYRLLREKADVYHLHNPFSLPLALALKLVRQKVIYDVHEDFAERILIRDWVPEILRPAMAGFVKNVEILAGKMVNGAIATQPDVADRLGPRAIVLENAPMINDALVDRAETFARQIPDDVANPEGAFRLIYAGSLSRVRGLPVMLEALHLVNAFMPARLWLVGPPDDEDGLAEAARHPGWMYVDLIGRLDHQHEVFGYMRRSDAGLALFRDWGGYSRISSNKLYEYMASGIPFIASAFPTWMKRLESIGAGFFCDPSDADCIASNVINLAENPASAQLMARRGQAFVQDHFNWDDHKELLLALYKNVIAGSPERNFVASG